MCVVCICKCIHVDWKCFVSMSFWKNNFSSKCAFSREMISCKHTLVFLNMKKNSLFTAYRHYPYSTILCHLICVHWVWDWLRLQSLDFSCALCQDSTSMCRSSQITWFYFNTYSVGKIWLISLVALRVTKKTFYPLAIYVFILPMIYWIITCTGTR